MQNANDVIQRTSQRDFRRVAAVPVHALPTTIGVFCDYNSELAAAILAGSAIARESRRDVRDWPSSETRLCAGVWLDCLHRGQAPR